MGGAGAALFYPAFYGGSVLLVIMVALIAPVSRPGVRWGARTWARWFVWCARWFLGIRLVVRGRVPDERVIVASKHTSAYETILTLYLFREPAVVMKAELRRIPFWGYIAARHGSIFVERAKGGAALRPMLREATARGAEGRPVFIFPEGTRVAQGSAPPLRAGLWALYEGLGVPVVPVAHDAGLVWTKGWRKRPGTVTLSFLEAVPAGLSREEMEARVHAAINADPRAAEVRA